MFLNFYIIDITSILVVKMKYWEKPKWDRKAATKQALKDKLEEQQIAETIIKSMIA